MLETICMLSSLSKRTTSADMLNSSKNQSRESSAVDGGKISFISQCVRSTPAVALLTMQTHSNCASLVLEANMS
jgi:hypothetical protein